MARTKILICGGTGFIGRNLVEHFSQQSDYDVSATHYRREPFASQANIRWLQCDFRQLDDVNRALEGQDIVIQAAAVTSGSKDIVEHPYIHICDNAVMNSNILSQLRRHSIKHFMFFSCSIVYPSSPLPQKESDFTGEIHQNYFGAGWTKVYIEKMCKFYSQQADTLFTVVRHSNVYGPWDKYDLNKSHVFGATVAKVFDESPQLTVWGDGSQTRDFLHINDLISFVKSALDKQSSAYEIYNCGSGRVASVKELVSMMLSIHEYKKALLFDKSKPAIDHCVQLDCTKAETELGWKANISLIDGIRSTLNWYMKHHNNR